jgi:hypothetical protein
MRLALALVAGVATAALGAVVLGEYQLTGITGVIAGALFGLAVAEMVLTASGPSLSRGLDAAMVVTAAATAAGLVWAGWISAGHDWGYFPKGLMVGVVVGAAVGPYWLRSGMRRGVRVTPSE